ncbi:hypothetical protein DMENIID0001_155610 [Sergentomyia squamirostris]
MDFPADQVSLLKSMESSFAGQGRILKSMEFPADHVRIRKTMEFPADQLSSTAKVARWFSQLPWNQASLSRPESGFVSGDSRSEKNILGEDTLDHHGGPKEPEFCDEYLLVEGTANLWAKLSAKKRRKLLGLRLGKVTTF